MLTKINHSSLFSPYLLIVSVVVILTPCYSLDMKHFTAEEESLIFEKHSQGLNASIVSIENFIKDKLPG